MRTPLVSILCLSLVGLSTAAAVLEWTDAAFSREHAMPSFDLSRRPLDAATLGALERTLGDLAVHAALALEHVAPGDDVFVVTSHVESRDAFKKARIVSNALRALLSPSNVAVLRDVLTARPSAWTVDELWLLQIELAHEAELSSLGFERVEARGRGCLWRLGADG